MGSRADLNEKPEVLYRAKLDFEPKVSVIIPVYNTEQYLRECLDSVVNQTLKEIEVICVDDGSTDSSLEILKEYAEKDKRFTILAQQNLHAGVARNAGLAIASGEYVHFLDSDDWIRNKTYAELYDLISKKEAEIVKFKSYSYNNKTKEIEVTPYTNVEWVNQECFENYLSISTNTYDTLRLPDSPWSGIYKRSFLEEKQIFFDDLICANDIGFFYRCITNATKIYLTSNRYVYYRENNEKSLIANKARYFYCQTSLFEIVEKISKNSPLSIQNEILNKIIETIFHWYFLCIEYPNLSHENIKNINKEMNNFIKKIKHVKLIKTNKALEYEIRNKLINKAVYLIQLLFSIKKKGKHITIQILGIKLNIKIKNCDKTF